MKYILDSNIVSDIYNPLSQNHAKLALKLKQLEDTDEVYVSILTLYELSYGLANAPENKKSEIKRQLFLINQHFHILPLPHNGVMEFGKLKSTLREKQTISSKNMSEHNIDIMLAATAIAEQAILVSADKIFMDLKWINEQLQIENWLI